MKDEKGKGKSRYDIACVYFGADRKDRLRRLAKAQGFGTNLSAFVCALCDVAAAKPPAVLASELAAATRPAKATGKPPAAPDLSRALSALVS